MLRRNAVFYMFKLVKFLSKIVKSFWMSQGILKYLWFQVSADVSIKFWISEGVIC